MCVQKGTVGLRSILCMSGKQSVRTNMYFQETIKIYPTPFADPGIFVRGGPGQSIIFQGGPIAYSL